MYSRPRIQVEKASLDHWLERAALALLLFLWAYTLYDYFTLPETIPTHFNARGEPDDYGSKATLLLLPVIGSVIYLVMNRLNRYPHLMNYPVTITEDNAAAHYRTALRLLRIVKAIVLLIFSAIVVMTHRAALQPGTGLGRWFLPVTVLIILCPTLIAIFAFKNKAR